MASSRYGHAAKYALCRPLVVAALGCILAALSTTTEGGGGTRQEQEHDTTAGAVEIKVGRTIPGGLAVTAPFDHSRALQLMTDGPTDNDNICGILERSFQKNVRCTCLGDAHNFFSISCEYLEPLCNNGTGALLTCGKPIIGVTVVSGKVFSSTSCIRDYTKGSRQLKDTCVIVETCEDLSQGLCGCTASYDGQVCETCSMCEGGKSLTFDCTNVNADAVSNGCSVVDIDLDLRGGSGLMAGFVPELNGFCSALESKLNSRIACDCTDAVGGTFDITCANDLECRSGLCRQVNSTVRVVNSQVSSMTTCTSQENPFGETCTSLQYCEGDDAKDRVCACLATYSGQACAACEVCSGGQAIKLDCSNVYERAIVTECQQVDASQSFEFVPNYTKPQLASVSISSSKRVEIAVLTSFAVAAFTALMSGLVI